MPERPPPHVWQTLKPIARRFRREPTAAESLLWRSLRAGDGNAKFRRQHPIGIYIVDFYCDAAKLVIEVDGPIHHGQQQRDADREAYLEMLGLRVLRFTNEAVISSLSECLRQIRRLVDGPA